MYNKAFTQALNVLKIESNGRRIWVSWKMKHDLSIYDVDEPFETKPPEALVNTGFDNKNLIEVHSSLQVTSIVKDIVLQDSSNISIFLLLQRFYTF